MFFFVLLSLNPPILPYIQSCPLTLNARMSNLSSGLIKKKKKKSLLWAKFKAFARKTVAPH